MQSQERRMKMRKSKKNVVSGNYLDYIPVISKSCEYKIGEDGKVIIMVENKGVINTIAQKLFKRPRFTKVHLDKMGNFIWPLLDGERTIYDISVLVKERFGDEAEPLYNRLVQYLRNVESYGFIEIQKTDD